MRACYGFRWFERSQQSHSIAFLHWANRSKRVLGEGTQRYAPTPWSMYAFSHGQYISIPSSQSRQGTHWKTTWSRSPTAKPPGLKHMPIRRKRTPLRPYSGTNVPTSTPRMPTSLPYKNSSPQFRILFPNIPELLRLGFGIRIFMEVTSISTNKAKYQASSIGREPVPLRE